MQMLELWHTKCTVYFTLQSISCLFIVQRFLVVVTAAQEDPFISLILLTDTVAVQKQWSVSDHIVFRQECPYIKGLYTSRTQFQVVFAAVQASLQALQLPPYSPSQQQGQCLPCFLCNMYAALVYTLRESQSELDHFTGNSCVARAQFVQCTNASAI